MTHIPQSRHSCASVSLARYRLGRTLCAALALALVSGITAHAASATWSGAGANDKWSTGGAGGNWGGAAAPGSTSGTSTDTASFTSAVGNSALVNIDSNDQNIGSITFAASAVAYTIGDQGANVGNSLFLNSGGSILNSSANAQTINAPLVLVAATTGTYTINDNTATSGVGINIAGNISTSATGAFALNLTGNGSTTHTSTLSGIISNGSNGGTLSVNLVSGANAQTYVLSGSNTYSGGTTINSGVIVINSDSSLGADPGSAQANNIVIAGATLNANAGYTFTAPTFTNGTITLNSNRGMEIGNAGGTVTSGTIATAAGTNLNLSGNITNGDSAASDTVYFTTANTSTVVVTGTVTGTFTDTSTISLTGSILNTSGANINGNVLFNGGSVGTASLTLTSNFLLGGNTSVSAGITLSNGGNIATVGNATLSGGTITLNGGTDKLTPANGSLLTISNVIAGSGTLWSNANSTGTVQLTGNNTYTGTTDISAVSGGGAQFILDVDGNSHALGSSLVLFQWSAGTGALVNSSATAATLQNNVQFESNQSYATGTVGGVNTYTFGGSGNITMEGSDTILGFNTTSGGVVYAGTGTLTFTGASGGVATGTFALANTSGYSGLTVFNTSAAGGELVMDNNLIDTSTITGTEVSSVDFFGKSTSTFIIAGNNSYSGSTTLNTGTFVFSGNNTTSAPFYLLAGTLDINSTTALGTGTLNIASGATIDDTSSSAITASNNVTFTGATGSFTYGGTQSLTLGSLSTANNFTSGTITLNGTGKNLTFTSLVNTGTSTTAPGYTLLVNSTAGSGDVLTLNSVQLSSSTNTVTATDIFQGTGNVVIGGFTNGDSTTPSNFTYSGTGTATINSTGMTGTLKESGGTMILASSGGGAGAVTLTGGALDLNNSGALGTATLNLGGGGTIDNTSSSAVSATNTATFATSGTVTYGGTKALTLALLNTATNFTSGTITLSGTSTLTISDLVNTGTSTTPGYTMTVNGSGDTLALSSVQLSSSTNTYTATDIFAGTGIVSIGAFTNGDSTAPSNFTYSGTGTAILSNTSALGGTLKESSGTMILSGNNTGQTGTLSLAGGTLDVNNARALTTTAVNNFGLSTGSVTVAFDNTSGTAITETLNPNINLYQMATFVGSNSLNLGTGTVTISTGTGTGITIADSNAVTLGIGTLQSSLASSATVTLSDTGGNNTFNIGNIVINTTATARSLTINGSSTNTNVTVGTISGGNVGDSLVYNSTGTMTITGGTTYTGGTTISSTAGITGEIYVASGASMTAGTGTTVTLNGGNLGGLGTVNGLVNMTSAGGINLQDGKIGTLTIGSMTSAGGYMQFEIGTGNQGTDKLAINGGFSINSSDPIYMNVENLNGAGTQSITSGTYTLVSYTGTQISNTNFTNGFDLLINGASGNTLDGDTLTLVQNGDNIQLVVTAPSANYYYTATNNQDFSTGTNYSSDLAGSTGQSGTLGSTSDVFISANTNAGTHNGPTVNTATTIDSLTFNSNGAGATVNGTATLTILGTNNSGIGLADTSTVTSTETVSAPIALGANQSWSVTTAGDTLKVSGQVSGAYALTTEGAGTIALANATGNTYSGGTTVSAGTLLVQNTSNSATGTGSLTVNGGATLAGTGIVNASAGSYSVTGTSTSNRATVLVGMTSSTDTSTSTTLTLLATGASTISNANLTFNLNAQVAGGLGGTSNGGSAGGLGVANSGTELSVGNTAISFGTGVGSVQLTLNLQNQPAIVSAFTPYVLIAGTGSTTDTSGVSGGQYTGLTLGNVTTLASGVTETLITGSNLQLAFAGSVDNSYYGAHSYLVLYQNSNTGVDDIDVEVVPEPGTWAMMLGGLGLLVFMQRLRRKDRS